MAGDGFRTAESPTGADLAEMLPLNDRPSAVWRWVSGGTTVDHMNSGQWLNLVNVWPTLLAAAEEARRTRHPHIGSEHLALLALDGTDGIEAMAIEGGLDATVIRAAIEACCDAPPVDGEPAVTPRTARMLAYAAQVALVEQAPEIRPVDLIAVLLNDPGAIAWRGLMTAGVGPDMLAAGLARRRVVGPPPSRRTVA